MPLGTTIHCIEIILGKGGQLAKAMGAVAKLIAKEGKSATLKLPSGKALWVVEHLLHPRPSFCRAERFVDDVSKEESFKAMGKGFDLLLVVSIGSFPSISTSFFIFARAAGPGSRFLTSKRSLCASVSSFAIFLTLSRYCLCATSAQVPPKDSHLKHSNSSPVRLHKLKYPATTNEKIVRIGHKSKRESYFEEN
ncbi:Ribosomal protein L2 [Cynara cardunculus var. scolymus]|uniref:Ribosomal protein L2 n=1 Tax=Cynara cardunculus var. scolymus TaxID=59895 RepID=A0A103XKV7_CYNCS|nr:Ribosomal protein L2 [Cynara cardunculus var. scolymus]